MDSAEAEVFKTRDLSLASAVSLLSGTDPILEADRRGTIIFSFDGTEEVRRLVAAYTDGSAIGPLLDFSERLKSLRSAMYNVQDLAR
jgi:hypothetical protein